MERKPFPSETQERFIVRFPDGMRDRIAEEAKKNNRSMNAEIVARLASTFAHATNAKPDVSIKIDGPIIHDSDDGVRTEITIQEFARILAREMRNKPTK